MKGDLRRHELTHDAGMHPFSCPFPMCGKTFAQKGNADRHYQRVHSEQGALHQKREERHVANALEDAGIHFKREHRIAFGCQGDTFAKVDFLVLRDGFLLLIEVDEHQHGYMDAGCDATRMAKIVESLALDGNSLPVCFVRFNPHAFRINGGIQTQTKPTRLAKLVKFCKEGSVPVQPMSIQYMFFDVDVQADKYILSTLADDAYPTAVAQCVLPPII